MNSALSNCIKYLHIFYLLPLEMSHQVRSSQRRCSVKKSVLRNFAKFTGKHLCQSLFSDKFSDLRLASSLKTRLWHRPFPMNFAKFLRTRFLQNTSGGCFCINKYFISLLILLLFVF